MRRILGVLALAKKYGLASTDEACAVALETGACEYRFVRRYLERNPQLPLSLRQVDPLIRQLTLYRDLIEKRTQNPNQETRLMNVMELERCAASTAARRHGRGAGNSLAPGPGRSHGSHRSDLLPGLG